MIGVAMRFGRCARRLQEEKNPPRRGLGTGLSCQRLELFPTLDLDRGRAGVAGIGGAAGRGPYRPRARAGAADDNRAPVWNWAISWARVSASFDSAWLAAVLSSTMAAFCWVT